ncbi:centromere/kinetochore protein zw10 isoform X3 [Drosophila grimshawi]|uniref:GH17890 n=1 Tax=Drosophila grimshawi TaxID=7222 RepID=B4JX65_DROGR|nr:centromere/kinetochore protein zw10 isoform X3 [Drosophila grimshawi]XP_032597277.1 centromere/kinetochore protein zw10 isoform X3 [Drosophila grimshawi]EDV95341.1 GH17890 [Drosophila grimshawi]
MSSQGHHKMHGCGGGSLAKLASVKSNTDSPTEYTDEIDLGDRCSADIARLCMNDRYADVEFIVEEQRLPAHRAILAARSKYFRALLYGGMSEGTQRQISLEVPLVPFKVLLRYIYSGILKLATLDEDAVIDALGMANQFGFQDLEMAISKYLRQSLALNNVCMILDAARLYNLDELTQVCLMFMDRNAEDLLQHDTFKMLSRESLEEVLRRDSFFAPEVKIFMGVWNWNCYNHDVDIKTVASLIRLPLIDNKDLLQVVRPSGILEPDKILAAIDERKTSTTLPHRTSPDTFLINPDLDTTQSESTEQFDTAREIIQRDLQDMTLVAPSNLSANVASDPLLFPRCMVSKSAQDFVELMERVLRQSDKAAEGTPNPLGGVIGLLLNVYINEVPKVHKKLLKSIPQQSALFYNNCMYLAHWVAQHTKDNIGDFPSLVKILQSTGNKHLRVQVDCQQSILMDIMSSFEFKNRHTSVAPLKVVRQCLRQLELLKNVWQQVLPENVYNNSFCELLQAFINELVQRVFSLDDITCSMRRDLSDLIDEVLKKAPLLFHDKNDVVHVRSWLKLQQLKIMMNALLKEFSELWCDGVGPLTANYHAGEVKQLIRARYMDTDQRAKAIAQIV